MWRFLAGFTVGACGLLLAGLLLWPRTSATDSAIDNARASASRNEALERDGLRLGLEASEKRGLELASDLRASEKRSGELAAGLAEMANRGDSVVIRLDEGNEGLGRALEIIDRIIEARSGSKGRE